MARSASPSRLLLHVAESFSQDRPLLDAGCGAGRNAIALAQLGFTVVCADRNYDCLGTLTGTSPVARSDAPLIPLCIELKPASWPFRTVCFSAILCVHYLDAGLLPYFHSSLIPGGCLFVETVGGQGQNYLELPAAGELRDLLSPTFDFVLYEERSVGPPASDRCAVKLLARKKLQS
jgi:SAM-dependent methyltransferase